MEHVTHCGLRLRALFVAIFAAAAFFTLAGVASAAFTTAGGGVLNDVASDEWDHAVTGTDANPAGTDCFDPLALTGVCSVRFEEATRDGLAEAVITWPAVGDPILESNLDVAVFLCLAPPTTDPATGQPVSCPVDVNAPSLVIDPDPNDDFVPGQNNTPAAAERVTWQAQAGATYAVTVIPVVVPLLVQDYHGCAGYVNSPSDCEDPAGGVIVPPPAEDFTCAPGPTDRKMTWGLTFKNSLTGQREQGASGEVKLRPRKTDPQGQVNWRHDVQRKRLHSIAVDCATFNDAERSVIVKGRAILKERTVDGGTTKREVCFSAKVTDRVQGNEPGDQFDITYAPRQNNECIVSQGETHSFIATNGEARYHFKA